MVHYSQGIASVREVVYCITSFATPNTVVAIDAPLIINNQTGQRPCERSISQKFGRRHASAHSSNLKLYPDAGGVKVAQSLEIAGFSHEINPTTDMLRADKWFFEVYPHPAQVVLFNLPRIIKYKKGRVSEKREGLRTLRQYIQVKLFASNPPLQPNDKLLELLQRDVEMLKGKYLKQYEDILDGVFCAYLAMYYWRWGASKNEMIGDLETGYIINPTDSV